MTRTKITKKKTTKVAQPEIKAKSFGGKIVRHEALSQFAERLDVKSSKQYYLEDILKPRGDTVISRTDFFRDRIVDKLVAEEEERLLNEYEEEEEVIE